MITAWLGGLLDDPLDVFRVPSLNWEGEDARHFVGVCLAGAVDDPLHEAGAGVQRHPHLTVIVDRAVPSDRWI